MAVLTGAPVRDLVASTTLTRQLNVAAAGPLGTAAYEAMTFLVRTHHHGGYGGRGTLLDLHATARVQVATLLGATAGCVSFQPSVSSVVTMLSRSVPLAPGEEVLSWAMEFPSNLRAWTTAARRSGASLVLVRPPWDRPLDTGLLVERVTERTRVVTVSSVQSLDGAATDLTALRAACDRVGALLLVDLSQHLGVADVTDAVSLADAAYSATHKWLLGPVGTAVLAARADLMVRLEPPAYGAGSADPSAPASPWFDPDQVERSDVGRLEAGTPALLIAVTAGAAAQALTGVGVARVQDQAVAARAALADVLARHGLSPLATVADPVSPILAVRPGDRLAPLAAALEERQVQHLVRGDVLRLSPWALDPAAQAEAATLLDQALRATG